MTAPCDKQANHNLRDTRRTCCMTWSRSVKTSTVASSSAACPSASTSAAAESEPLPCCCPGARPPQHTRLSRSATIRRSAVSAVSSASAAAAIGSLSASSSPSSSSPSSSRCPSRPRLLEEAPEGLASLSVASHTAMWQMLSSCACSSTCCPGRCSMSAGIKSWLHVVSPKTFANMLRRVAKIGAIRETLGLQTGTNVW